MALFLNPKVLFPTFAYPALVCHRVLAGMLAFLVVCIGTPLASATSVSAGKGEIGGPPTLRLGPPDEGKQMTPAIVIGRGRTFDGRVELVAYGWLAPKDSVQFFSRTQFCVWVEYPPGETNFGTCGPALDPSFEGPLAIDAQLQALGPPGQRYTEIGGRLSPDVATVRISFRRRGRGKLFHTDAIVAQVGGGLQRKLKQSAPFGYFDAKIRGLVWFRAFRAQALDGNGQVIGST